MRAAGGRVIPFQDRCTQGTSLSTEVRGCSRLISRGHGGPTDRQVHESWRGLNVLERFLAFFKSVSQITWFPLNCVALIRLV